MLVEILSVTLKKGIVEIQALDVSEENLSRMERMRDDMNNPELTFLLDTREEKVLMYLNNWLHRQKAVRKQECTTWGQALQAVVSCWSVRPVSWSFIIIRPVIRHHPEQIWKPQRG